MRTDKRVNRKEGKKYEAWGSKGTKREKEGEDTEPRKEMWAKRLGNED